MMILILCLQDAAASPGSDWVAALAIWGAIVATIALAWNVIRDQRDRRKLEVRYIVGGVAGALVPDEGIHLGIILTNVGRRPVMVQGCAVNVEDKSTTFIIFDKNHGLPKMLDEQESYTVLTTDWKKVAEEGITRVYAYDSSGKEWRMKRKLVKRLKKRLEKETGQDPAAGVV